MRIMRPFPEDETPESREVHVLPEIEELGKAHICQEEEQPLQLDDGAARSELVAEFNAQMGTSPSGGSSSSENAGATYPTSIKVAEGDYTGVKIWPADHARGHKQTRSRWVERWKESDRRSRLHDLRTDNTCAFLHASMEAKPKCKLYGTRRVSYLWGTPVPGGHGFTRLTEGPQTFWYPTREQPHGLEREMPKHFMVREQKLLGPGKEPQGSLLNRTIVSVPEPLAPMATAPTVKDGDAARADFVDETPLIEAQVHVAETGRAIYLSVDRHDTQDVVWQLVQWLSKPQRLDTLRLRHLAKYLKGTVVRCWTFALQSDEDLPMIQAVPDSDWAADPVTRKPVNSGHVATPEGHVLEHWVSGQQAAALPSGEAEFYAYGECIALGLLILYLLKEMKGRTKLRAGTNSSAAGGVLQRAWPSRIRHLQARYLWIQERARNREVTVIPAKGENSSADHGTRNLGGERARTLSRQLGLGVPLAGTKIAVLGLLAVEAGGAPLTVRGEPEEKGWSIVVAEGRLVADTAGIYITWATLLQMLFSLVVPFALWSLGKLRGERKALQRKSAEEGACRPRPARAQGTTLGKPLEDDERATRSLEEEEEAPGKATPSAQGWPPRRSSSPGWGSPRSPRRPTATEVAAKPTAPRASTRAHPASRAQIQFINSIRSQRHLMVPLEAYQDAAVASRWLDGHAPLVRGARRR